MVLFSFIFGIFYGFLFAIDDISDNNKVARFLKYELINSYTITLVPSLIGAVAGGVNEVLRLRENQIFY
jgi:hypothetical protein